MGGARISKGKKINNTRISEGNKMNDNCIGKEKIEELFNNSLDISIRKIKGEVGSLNPQQEI
jgi:hypothetical protein